MIILGLRGKFVRLPILTLGITLGLGINHYNHQEHKAQFVKNRANTILAGGIPELFARGLEEVCHRTLNVSPRRAQTSLQSAEAQASPEQEKTERVVSFCREAALMYSKLTWGIEPEAAQARLSGLSKSYGKGVDVQKVIKAFTKHSNEKSEHLDSHLKSLSRDAAESLKVEKTIKTLEASAEVYGFTTVHSPITLRSVYNVVSRHDSLAHYMGNMIAFIPAGVFVEMRLGMLLYGLAIFLLSLGSTAAAMLLLSNEGSSILTPVFVGFSGTVSGVLGLFWYLFRRHRVKVLQLFFIIPVIIKAPAVWAVIGFGFLPDVFRAFSSIITGNSDGVAFEAHLSGLFLGLILARAYFTLLRKNHYSMSGTEDRLIQAYLRCRRFHERLQVILHVRHLNPGNYWVCGRILMDLSIWTHTPKNKAGLPAVPFSMRGLAPTLAETIHHCADVRRLGEIAGTLCTLHPKFPLWALVQDLRLRETIELTKRASEEGHWHTVLHLLQAMMIHHRKSGENARLAAKTVQALVFAQSYRPALRVFCATFPKALISTQVNQIAVQSLPSKLAQAAGAEGQAAPADLPPTQADAEAQARALIGRMREDETCIPKASLFQRIIANMIDFQVASTITTACFLTSHLLFNLINLPSLANLPGLALSIFVLYRSHFLPLIEHGQSPGKQVVGLRVIREGAHSLGGEPAFRREVVYKGIFTSVVTLLTVVTVLISPLLTLLFFMALFALIYRLWKSTQQLPWDKWSQTVVVRYTDPSELTPYLKHK